MKIPTIWIITGVLLMLHALGIIEWSAWVIVGPVLVLVGIMCIPVLIGLYRGLKIRIVNGKPGNVR